MNFSTLSFSRCRRLMWLLLLAMAAPSADAQLSLQLSILDRPVTKPTARRSEAVEAFQRSIALGEAISVRVELRNTGNAPVEVMPSLDPAAGFLGLFLLTPEGQSNRFTAIRWETKDILLKQRPLAPGDRLVFETFLFGKLEDRGLRQSYLFNRGGKHELLAEYAVEKLGVRVRSNRVTVDVGPAVPGWEQLKQAGIVELVEGRIRSRQEVSNRVARVESILSAEKTHPLRAWIQPKAAAASGK